MAVPQAERAERMRERLLDATIELLGTAGYGQMSTNDVVRKAGVSRGALAHHFPTKADLVKAAAVRLLAQREADFRARFEAMAPEERTPARALDVLWSFYADPSGVALLELTFAARNHPEVKDVLGPITQQIEASTADVFVAYFPDLARLPMAEPALRAIYALFAGLMVTSLGGDSHGEEIREFLATLVSLSDLLVPLLPTSLLAGSSA